MGINLRLPILVLSLSVTATINAGVLSNIEEARQSLKDYALASCLKKVEPEKTVLSEDLGRMMGSLHFMGKGKHQIIQDQDTFETIYDPYQVSSEYLIKESELFKGNMKNGSVTKSLGCVRAYRSDRFEQFITSQDSYISY